MTDGNGLGAAPEGTTTPPTVASFIGEDGTLHDGWKSTLDETVRNDISLDSFKNLKDLAKSYVTTKSMVGKNRIAVPGDTSTELEWAEYYKAGGRPETVADYGLKPPEDFPADVLEQVFPKAKLEAWQDRFFKAGISKKAAQQFIADYARDIMADVQNMNNAKEADDIALKQGLFTEWGSAYDQKIHLGNIAIEAGTAGNADFKAMVIDKLGNDPTFIRFAANLGAKFAEGKSPSYAQVPTPSDLNTKINELMANPLYLNGSLKQRNEIANQIMALRERINKETSGIT